MIMVFEKLPGERFEMGRGRNEERVNWVHLFRSLEQEVALDGDSSSWRKIQTVPNRNNLQYLRNRFTEYEIISRANTGGMFDIYARPKEQP